MLRRAKALLTLAALPLSACNGLFYHPDAVVYSRPEALGTPCEEVWFTTPDGVRLHGWFLPAQAPRRGSVLHVHGNAQNLTSHVELVAWLPAAGFDVLVFDYRGYGRSEGEAPSREGTFLDATAALAYLRARPDVDAARTLVLGQSLGGAVALAVVGEGPPGLVRGVAVDSTFPTYQGMANQALGGWAITYPLAWLLVSGDHDPADSLHRLPPTPLLVIHGDADEVVPYAQGEELFALASNPKWMVRVQGARHLDALQTPSGRGALVEFFDLCLRDAPAPAR